MTSAATAAKRTVLRGQIGLQRCVIRDTLEIEGEPDGGRLKPPASA